MTNTNIRGRHRAPARTPIAALSQAASSQANRRGALVAASSGLIITMVATTASAAPQGAVEAAPKVGDTTITDAALESLSVAPVVTVAADAEWSVDTFTADSEPAPVVRTTVSRSTTRTTAATTTTATTTSESAASDTAAATAATTAVASSSIGGSAVAIAMQYIGTPYVYGGSTPAGFDCSGFTQYVFAQLGYSIGRTDSAQRYAGTVVSYADAQPGDLIWWPGHVGIYLGNGQHIAARQPGTPLSVSPIYRSNPTFIRIG